ncbi:uncharacterized protein LOC115938303 [Leptonychotes weddellii]|uniref:Uncharacterized protein LOC115938303 n=1 Tax=Leptonychotes weddellii TaxID=9713 RepID=A0A7F8Q8T3_LEPWE|nr:uncharacterized protein LOC115938303 [Leptonychotes weddellii]
MVIGPGWWQSVGMATPGSPRASGAGAGTSARALPRAGSGRARLPAGLEARGPARPQERAGGASRGLAAGETRGRASPLSFPVLGVGWSGTSAPHSPPAPPRRWRSCRRGERRSLPARAGPCFREVMPPRRSEKYKLPVPLPEGKVLDDMEGKQWMLGKMIGSGGFGLIYLGWTSVRFFFNVSNQVILDENASVERHPLKARNIYRCNVIPSNEACGPSLALYDNRRIFWQKS